MNSEKIQGILFEDLVGQDSAISFLNSAIQNNRLANAYLFVGPDGVGRQLAALRFLEGILASGSSSQKERRRLKARNHPDMLWIEPTYNNQGKFIPQSLAKQEGLISRNPPQIRLEQIREVTNFLGKRPLEAFKNMVIIESIELMSETGANALLKTLEEPGQGMFILISTRPEKLLPTIRSRCQQIQFSRLDSKDLQKVLYESKHKELQENMTDCIQEDLLKLANGSPGALIEHIKMWQEIPKELWPRLNQMPENPIGALNLAKDITETLTGEQQLWLIQWLEQNFWYKDAMPHQLIRLNKLRVQLLGFVHPRLAWEITLLELLPNN